MDTKEIITKNTLIGTLVKEHPEIVPILLDHGVQCIGCHIATWETLEQTAKEHFIDINQLVKALNNKLTKS